VRKPGTESESSQAAADTDKKVEIAAVRLLARREHGTRELKRKLSAKGHDDGAVNRVLEKLETKKLVSDERFVSTFVHHRARRGQGPARIRAELRQQGIADSQIEQEIANSSVDWVGAASAVRRRKFGTQRPASLAERAKQARFLQYRGFTADQIRAALQTQEGDNERQCDADPSSESVDQDWPD
jgi:regulatory protein